MNLTQTAFKSLAALALGLLAVGCTELQKKQQAARSAGFQVITPHTPDQVALLPMLPPRMTLINYKGQPVYVLPDVQHNRAYVGKLSQYEAYHRIREAQHEDDDDTEAPRMATLDFGTWDASNAGRP